MDLNDFKDAFFEEADELLRVIESELLEIDVASPDSEDLNAVFRAAHSIKGGAGTFGFTELQETTHLLENLLDDARKGVLKLSQDIVDKFLETKDMLKEQLDAYREGRAPDQDKFEALCRMLKEIGESDGGGTDSEAVAASSSGEASAAAESDTAAPTTETTGFEIFSDSDSDAEVDVGDSVERQLKVTLTELEEKDRELVITELGNFGRILDRSGDDGCLEIVVATDENIEDLEAVLYFVIDEQQLAIEELKQASSADAEELHKATGDVTDVTADGCVDGAAAPAADSASGGTSAVKPDADKVPVEEDAGVATKKAKLRSSAETSSIRVAVDKVDQVINLVGELIITQSMLNETVSGMELGNNSDLYNGINLLQRNARDLQEAVMSIRMLPMDYVFSRFPRLVRDLARKMGKEINLVMEGEGTELDKGLTEGIIDPLTHLVRNSLDHGLEAPDVRQAAGKPREGELVLSAQHQGGNIVIEVRDDGAGLNRERILEKARSGSLPVPENPSDDEVWQLIFEPGFSTAEQVSDLSGRGVGMDVVKRNIQSMGGHVEIASSPGQGTSTRIVLPLTLAILDGMLIRVGTEVYIIPVSAVIESLQLRDERLTALPGNVPMLKVRDEYYPVVSMYDAMGVSPSSRSAESERRTAVMVQGGNAKFVMLVDELLGQQQVVVKNLESNYRRIPGVSAATILGDGSVALILDVVDLLSLSKNRRRGFRSGAARDGGAAAPGSESPPKPSEAANSPVALPDVAVTESHIDPETTRHSEATP
jgi:two-component system chemotaxis sensor kinase CheA